MDAADETAAEVPTAEETGQGAGVRLDRWLWAARLFKTRSLARKAVVAGHVKVDGDRVKPAKTVRCGQRIEALTPGGPRVVEVAGLSEKRGPAVVARELYVDHTPVESPSERLPRVATRARGAGRPSKRDRRLLIRFRDRGGD